MSSTSDERRRSERLWLTVPVTVVGTDSAGQDFECEARVINLSRHGARVQVPHQLAPNHLILLQSPDGNHQADFRIVGLVAPASAQVVEYCAECVNEAQNFWQIEFPPPEDVNSENSKVLVECIKCNTMALLPLTILEVQAVRSMGWVGKACSNCARVSLWKYAHLGKSQNHSGSPKREARHRPPSWIGAAMDSTGRNHRRVYVLMPLEVQNAQGDQEITRTENISKCGFCFASDKAYQPGDAITAIFENAEDSVNHQTRLSAKIVREQAILGSSRKLYGATYR
jgi:hypothetical protein